MLFISLDRKVCLSEPKLNSVSLAAKAVVLKAQSPNIFFSSQTMLQEENKLIYLSICISPIKKKMNTWYRGHRGFWGIAPIQWNDSQAFLLHVSKSVKDMRQVTPALRQANVLAIHVCFISACTCNLFSKMFWMSLAMTISGLLKTSPTCLLTLWQRRAVSSNTSLCIYAPWENRQKDFFLFLFVWPLRVLTTENIWAFQKVTGVITVAFVQATDIATVFKILFSRYCCHGNKTDTKCFFRKHSDKANAFSPR